MDNMELILQELKSINSRLDKLETQKEEIIHEVKVLLDTEVNTKFNLLAEELQLLNQKVDALSVKDASPDVDVIKMAIKQLNWEIQQLKKAQ